MRRLSGSLAAMLLGLGAATAGADPIDLKPFRATYVVEWKGMSAANSILELRRSGDDLYEYSSVNTARGLFRMAFSDAVTQISTFRLVDGHVTPLAFRGTDEKERRIDLAFDWQKNRVTGTAKDRAVDLELMPDTQDPMALQIAALRDLAAGRLKDTVWMLDGDKLKEYQLRQEGRAQIDTALGSLDTIIYTSQRAGGDRVTRTWVAPALGYLPVQAERTRGKKLEFTLRIIAVEP